MATGNCLSLDRMPLFRDTPCPCLLPKFQELRLPVRIAHTPYLVIAGWII